MTKKEKMYEEIENHGKVLIDYFGLDEDPIKLCKKLRRLENKANRIMIDYCNGDINYDEVENFCLYWLKPRLIKIFGEKGYKSIYVNQDPRGYTLKANETESKKINGYKDWGGYFILAPDFSI